MADIKIGDNVEYRVADTDDWETGVVHGIKKAEATDGSDIILGYLVDTGNDFDVQERHHDHRGTEITKRVVKMAEKNKKIKTDNKEFAKAVAQVDEENKDLPEPGITVEKIRQPEQVEIAPENIRLAK